ncbi:MAG: hypothetical protein HKN33_10705 [Pyrinomonadaceae bacterium]|nr:hypothetical protein [Pyrinomonadaceae bacterium]
MNKIKLSIAMSALFVVFAATPAYPCGQQHMERCAVPTTVEQTESDQKKLDTKTIIVLKIIRFFKYAAL